MLQHPRRDERDGRRRDATQPQAEGEAAPVAEQVRQQAADRGQHPSQSITGVAAGASRRLRFAYRIRAMHALYVLVPILCILAIAYRYYSAFIAARLLVLDDTRRTPAHTQYDGHNYYPTTRWVLFGHHFAAITGAGPLVGPVLAAQFGYAPGLIWLVTGVCTGRRGARPHHPLGVDPPRRPLAGGDRAHRDRPGGGRHRPASPCSSSSSSRSPASASSSSTP